MIVRSVRGAQLARESMTVIAPVRLLTHTLMEVRSCAWNGTLAANNIPVTAPTKTVRGDTTIGPLDPTTYAIADPLCRRQDWLQHG